MGPVNRGLGRESRTYLNTPHGRDRSYLGVGLGAEDAMRDVEIGSTIVPEFRREPPVLKWLLTLFIALVVLTALSPWLARFGLGRLPGDVTVRVKGRELYLPFTTTIVLSLALTLLIRLL